MRLSASPAENAPIVAEASSYSLVESSQPWRTKMRNDAESTGKIGRLYARKRISSAVFGETPGSAIKASRSELEAASSVWNNG